MNKNIFIAEDNPVNRELLRELLETRGCFVREACNGREALDMLKENIPDVLLLDLSMPVLDGYGTISEIRNDPRLATLPVLAVTAYAMRGDREKILNAGFDGYLSKPVEASALWAELARLEKKRGLSDQFSGEESRKKAGAAANGQ
ncbi:MAG TPA: response regulator [Verrucomicrobiae bacterium]|jgi:CheY-like chemotaxis protein|nr:response regulator [Verrucomicrobiae bacterium]